MSKQLLQCMEHLVVTQKFEISLCADRVAEITCILLGIPISIRVDLIFADITTVPLRCKGQPKGPSGVPCEISAFNMSQHKIISSLATVPLIPTRLLTEGGQSLACFCSRQPSSVCIIIMILQLFSWTLCLILRLSLFVSMVARPPAYFGHTLRASSMYTF